MVEGLQLRPDENDPQRTGFSARLKSSREPVRLLLVANAAEAFGEYEPVFGAREEEVRRRVVTGLRTDYPEGMPMYGQADLESLDATQANTLQVTLLRAVARVDVEVDLDRELSREFVIQSVYIYRAGDRLQAMPDASALVESGRLLVRAPSVPSGMQAAEPYFKERESPVDNYIHRVYLPEAAEKVGATARQLEAACIVVGGYYNGEEEVTYYRADFDSGLAGHPFGQVLRNHRYRFRIRQVTGRGWETPGEAAENLATTIVAEIQAWEDFTTEMYAAGENYLGISSRDAVLGYRAGSTHTLYVQATVPYRIAWKGAAATTTVGGEAIAGEYFTARVEVCPGQGDDVSRIVFTALGENDTSADHVSELTVEWGNWTFTIRVTQLHYATHVRRSVRVLSVHIGSAGQLGTATAEGDGLGMRRILTRMENFSPRGTVDYFSGFDFSAVNYATFNEPDGTNDVSHRMTSALYGCDVLYLGNDNNASAFSTRAVMEWLEASPNRVLVVGTDNPIVSPHFVREDYGGVLAGDAEWWYNQANGGNYHVRSTGASHFVPYAPNARNREFMDGVFGSVNPEARIVRADGYYGYAVRYGENIVPLVGLNNYPDYMVVGVDKSRRIVYHGDASLFQAGQIGNTTGVVAGNAHATLWANIWAWIAHQVIWGDDTQEQTGKE